MSLKGNTNQNDNFDSSKRQVMLVIPINRMGGGMKKTTSNSYCCQLVWNKKDDKVVINIHYF